MTGKYADRFRPSSPAGQRDVLDPSEAGRGSLVRDDHDADELVVEPPLDRRWHQGWAARFAVVAALVVGAGAGAFAWDRWESYEAGVAARGTIELVASATPLNYPTENEITVAMRYRNDGEHKVVVREVRLDSSQAVIVGDPRVLTIAPGTSETHMLDVRAQCDDDADRLIERPLLAVEVETVDGTVRTVRIDSNLTSEILDWLQYACARPYEPTFAESYAEVVETTPSVDGTSLEARLVLGSGDGRDVTVSSIEAMSYAFTVELVRDGDAGSSEFTIIFRVRECILARDSSDLDMTVRVKGSYDGGAPGQIAVPPTATLAAELVRLAERSCPD